MNEITVVIIAPANAQSLDISGPLAVFREANRQSGIHAKYDVKIMSTQKSKTVVMDGMTVVADASIYDWDAAIDTLLVAGTEDYKTESLNKDLQAWLKKSTATSRRYGSICTGAFFLGAAKLLDNKKVTTHWQQAQELSNTYPLAEVQPDDIYVQDGPLNTSAGVTAGIDLALKLIEDDNGKELALNVARRLVVFLKRPGGQSQFSAHLEAQIAEESRIQSVQQWILDNLDADLSIPVIAKRSAMSIRNFSRLFRNEAGRTPADFVESARVEKAKRLLEESETPLQKVAAFCGFTNVDTMRRAFLRRTGINPSDYRQRFPQSQKR